MEYYGELYGKIGKKYFPIGTTAAEVDKKIKKQTKPKRYMIETDIMCVGGKFPRLETADSPIRTVFVSDVDVSGRILAYSCDPNSFFHTDVFRHIPCNNEKDLLESVAAHIDGGIIYAWHGEWEFEYLSRRTDNITGKHPKWEGTVSLLQVYKAMFPQYDSFALKDVLRLDHGSVPVPGFVLFKKLIAVIDGMAAVYQAMK